MARTIGDVETADDEPIQCENCGKNIFFYPCVCCGRKDPAYDKKHDMSDNNLNDFTIERNMEPGYYTLWNDEMTKSIKVLVDWDKCKVITDDKPAVTDDMSIAEYKRQIKEMKVELMMANGEVGDLKEELLRTTNMSLVTICRLVQLGEEI